MLYSICADLVVILHLAFVLFAVAGGLLALRFRYLAWIHIPAVLWAAYVEFSGRICPLTYMEMDLRQKAGRSGYNSGFVEHYLLPILYPEDLTRSVQIILGFTVLAINVGAYLWLWKNKRKK
jgi:hypothetical protein